MSSDLRGARVLIVDDNTNNLAVLFNYLDGVGYVVLVSQDGETALELASRELPELILLDVLLPGINGFETCRRLKADPRTADIPVLFISALSDIQDKVEGFESGGVDYITKPFQQEEVLARINAHLTITRQREELNRLNATKSRFFGVIAHDLRGPFMGLLGALELMKDSIETLDPETLRTMAASLHESAEKTYHLLNNLLEWARSQQNQVEYHPTQLVLYQVVFEIAQLFRPTARQKSVEIVNDVSPEIMVTADRNMLSTVLRNLINNAVKFTPAAGTVTISAAVDDQMVTVTVADTGVGIPESALPHLFDLEHSSSREGTSGEKGSGLGLLLARDYVDRHGGRIWATSTPGAGSRFSFTVPLPGGSM
jgi:two-component system, sensor histidine kinase and response regulator